MNSKMRIMNTNSVSIGCGNYCKYLSKEDQKIITEIEFAKKDAKLVNGQKRYLICAKWWRQWCDYVNFDDGCFG
jgi:hypothetical protein